MRKVVMMLFAVGSFAMIVGWNGVEPVYSQMRVPPTHVAALATQSVENETPQEQGTSTWSAQSAAQVLPVQHIVPQQGQTVTTVPPQPAPQNVVPQAIVMPQVQAVMPQAMPQPQPGMMTGGVIVIPVVVPQYVTYTPPPVTMMVNQPAQLVIPQYPPQMMAPMPQQMMPPMYYNPMAMQMMPQQQMMPQPSPQQPIPVKMILPDGSKVSIKHYMPGQYFKNAMRAITP